jgi:hypothetical protein
MPQSVEHAGLKPNGIEVCAVEAPPILNEPVSVLLGKPSMKPTDAGFSKHEVIVGRAPDRKLGLERLDSPVRDDKR